MNHVEHQPGELGSPGDSSPGGRIRWAAGVPRWVKVFVITALGLALLMVAVMLLSGGDHGPGRHFMSGGLEGPVACGAAVGNSASLTYPQL
jgi:hypothetical protein